jgi:hypothetical protein
MQQELDFKLLKGPPGSEHKLKESVQTGEQKWCNIKENVGSFTP